jgi:predicted ATP-grasp superfamily ATP-dependent carboligase
LAERLDVAAPRTVVVDACPDPRSSFDPGLPLPIVLKPRRSRVRRAGRWIPCSVTYAQTTGELSRRLESYPAEAYPILLQERIEGPGVGVFMCYAGGRPVAEFSHQRLREKPPTGGVSVYCESIALSDEAARASRALLNELAWRGVAMVEFKRDLRDGRLKLMEINARFWGSLQLAVDAGVDFPAILLESWQPGFAAAVPAYQIGVKSRWLWGDFDSLLLRIRSARGQAERLSALLAFLKLWSRHLRYENPRMSDLGPWVRETVERVRSLGPTSVH